MKFTRVNGRGICLILEEENGNEGLFAFFVLKILVTCFAPLFQLRGNTSRIILIVYWTIYLLNISLWIA